VLTFSRRCYYITGLIYLVVCLPKLSLNYSIVYSLTIVGRHGRPQEGVTGSHDPLDFDINFSHIITVAPEVEIQMHFWKGAKFAGSVGHPMTKMLSASGGLRPPDPLTGGSAPVPPL